MKTTIELPDELADAARSVAREQGTTLRDLMVTGLREEIARRTVPSVRPDFVFPTAGGVGLLVEPAEAIERSYGITA